MTHNNAMSSLICLNCEKAANAIHAKSFRKLSFPKFIGTKEMLQLYGKSMGVIGFGAFGTVTKHKYGQKFFALKTANDANESWREKEVCEFLMHHKHGNIVDIFNVCLTDKLVIVMEYISKSLRNVLDYMRNSNKRLKINYTKIILHGIACGLNFLHDHLLIHRDIKPENVLVVMSTYTAKICDFGTAKFLQRVNTTYICTRFYRAPEQILDCSYTFAADLWSFGCIAGEIAIGSPFFVGSSNTSQLCEIIKKIGCISEDQMFRMKGEKINLSKLTHLQSKPWSRLFNVSVNGKNVNTSYGTDFEDFISKLLVWDPAERLTAHECTKHCFLENVC